MACCLDGLKMDPSERDTGIYGLLEIKWPPYVESCSFSIVQHCSVNETADMYMYGETTKH